MMTEAPSRSRAISILVAEDLAMNRTLVSLMLQKAGYAVTGAADGDEAVSVVRQQAFDLVLMDVQMPVMDGLEATRAIRALPGVAGQVPIVALTADIQPANIAAYQAAGMNDYLAKPIDRAKLLAIVAQWVGR
ncbi:MAG: response regulator [Azospirillaceae bacterium]|nr:response regulator [Azospirillaceae bacterium]